MVLVTGEMMTVVFIFNKLTGRYIDSGLVNLGVLLDN